MIAYLTQRKLLDWMDWGIWWIFSSSISRQVQYLPKCNDAQAKASFDT